jgi:hypothetical protein
VELGEEENGFGEVEEGINGEKGKSACYVMAPAMRLMAPTMTSMVCCFFKLDKIK